MRRGSHGLRAAVSEPLFHVAVAAVSQTAEQALAKEGNGRSGAGAGHPGGHAGGAGLPSGTGGAPGTRQIHRHVPAERAPRRPVRLQKVHPAGVRHRKPGRGLSGLHQGRAGGQRGPFGPVRPPEGQGVEKRGHPAAERLPHRRGRLRAKAAGPPPRGQTA